MRGPPGGSGRAHPPATMRMSHATIVADRGLAACSPVTGHTPSLTARGITESPNSSIRSQASLAQMLSHQSADQQRWFICVAFIGTRCLPPTWRHAVRE